MIKINLLPRERSRRGGPALSRMTLVVGVVAVAVLLAGYALLLAGENARLKADLDNTNQQITALKPQVAHVEALKRRIEAAQRKADLLKSLEATRVSWDVVLEEFRVVMPKDVWVTGMSVADDGAVSVDGFGLSYESVARMMVSLDTSKVFREIDLEGAQKQSITAATDVVNFRLTGRLRSEHKEAGTR